MDIPRWMGAILMRRVVNGSKRLRHLAAALPAAALFFAVPVAEAQRGSPFTAYVGTWSGGGDIVMTDGAKERIRCKA